MPRYDAQRIEPKWQAVWEQQQTFRLSGFDPGKPKMYVLDMFPYPSGSGLHVGHPEGYTATDIVCRYNRMRGKQVLHPMGWDAFGLPAEEHAIKTGTHPRITTEQNIDTFRRQLKMLGFSYDWSREFATTDPDYYRWTQWIFLQVFDTWYDAGFEWTGPDGKLHRGKGRPISELPIPDEVRSQGDTAVRRFQDQHRLAYQHEAPVNWCPELGTVIANEEVIDGKSERGGHPVVRLPLRQWMLRITAYAERLIDDLEGLNWSESIKLLQRNWIGKSEGAEVDFFIGSSPLPPGEGSGVRERGAVPTSSDSPLALTPALSRGEREYEDWKSNRTRTGFPCEPGPDVLRIYTTRPDTLFGATYMVIAPEHPAVKRLTTPEQSAAVETYCKQAAMKSDLDRTDLAKTKSGVFTGSHAINPVNGEKIPIWIADYVLISYGTGAIMAVPAHDDRDLEFANAFKLPIKVVVAKMPKKEPNEGQVQMVFYPASPDQAFTGEGVAVNSGPYNDLATFEFKSRITADIAAQGLGRKAINYRLRDWLFSRQRYWGEPFPIWHELDASDQPTGLLRADSESALPITLPDMAEFKPTGTPEPMLAKAPTEWLYKTAPDGTRLKRETNTMPQWAGSCWYYLRFIDPKNNQRFIDSECEKQWLPVDLYVGGAEHAVLHLLYSRFWHKVLFDRGYVSTVEPFQRLINQGMILGENGEKMSKSRGNIINPDDVVKAYGADSLRLYEMFMGPLEAVKPWSMQGVEGVFRFLARVWRMTADEKADDIRLNPAIQDIEPSLEQLRLLHKTIKVVTRDIEAMSFNTAISRMMEFVNEIAGTEPRPKSLLPPFVLLLSPFAPHLAEELWQLLGHEKSLAYEPWPEFDPKLVEDAEVEIPVQINGKLRAKVLVPTGSDQAAIETAAATDSRIAELLAGKQIVKTVVVPGRLVNFVVK
ncbi:MAG: leucine--tRNA ligase [Planctomycetales bacterium]|nr:leucine--tRNA ligase [Planctomycetales bacterium]